MGESKTDDRLVKVVLVVRDGLVQIVEQLNDILETYAPETAIPDLDIAAINELPWVSYQTKQPCKKPDEAGWIFSDLQKPAAQELVKAIKAADGPLQLGNVEYKFSGEGDMFVSKRPVKMEK